MRALGLDLGEKRIGLALSDPSGTLASPWKVIPRRPDDGLASLEELVRQEGVQVIVVGLPLSLSGESGPQARQTLDYCERLRERVKVPVVTWDERLTTAAAERALLEGGLSRAQRKDRRDIVAAAILLQSYLDSQRYSREEAP